MKQLAAFLVAALVVGIIAACVPQQQQQPQPQPYGYGAGGYRQPGPAMTAPAATPAATPAAAPAAAPAARRVTFNRAPLDERGWQIIAALEAHFGTRLPDGNYWYDRTSGAAGPWGGPAATILPAGMPLGGQLSADASGGGNGRLSGVFINGRELHPADVAALQAIYGQVYQGRFWVDGQGNAGYEGGPALVNLYVLARQVKSRGGYRDWSHRTTTEHNGNLWTGGDSNGNVYMSDSNSGCTYMNDGGGVMC